MKINNWEKKSVGVLKFLVNFKISIVTRLVFGKGQSSGLDLRMAASCVQLLSMFIYRILGLC